MTAYSNTLDVDGTLTLTDGYQGITNATVDLGGAGTLILRPGVQLGGSSSTGTITGTGTLKLYAQQLEDGRYDRYPKLYGTGTKQTIDEQVQSTVTVWRNWVEGAACTHRWDSGVVTAATCAEDGFVTYTCQDCGSTKTQANGRGAVQWECEPVSDRQG